MGNCLRRESTMVWAGDDWGSVESSRNSRRRRCQYDNSKDTEGRMENMKLLGEIISVTSEYSSSFSSSGSVSSRELKLKISKKELEQLAMQAQGLSLEQVLSHLINGADRHDLHPHLDYQRSWRPVLQSIPEVN